MGNKSLSPRQQETSSKRTRKICLTEENHGDSMGKQTSVGDANGKRQETSKVRDEAIVEAQLDNGVGVAIVATLPELPRAVLI